MIDVSIFDQNRLCLVSDVCGIFRNQRNWTLKKECHKSSHKNHARYMGRPFLVRWEKEREKKGSGQKSTASLLCSQISLHPTTASIPPNQALLTNKKTNSIESIQSLNRNQISALRHYQQASHTLISLLTFIFKWWLIKIIISRGGKKIKKRTFDSFHSISFWTKFCISLLENA